jgi:hypothetical protein
MQEGVCVLPGTWKTIFSWKNLNDCLRIATKEEDEEAMTKITAIFTGSSNTASGKN